MPKVWYNEMLPHEIDPRSEANLEYGQAGVKAVVDAIVKKAHELLQECTNDF